MEVNGQTLREREKWKYIHLLSLLEEGKGDILLKMMDHYGANNLQEITEEQARSYWEQAKRERTGGKSLQI